MYNLEIEIINTLKQEQLYGLLNIARFLYIYGKVWYPFDSFWVVCKNPKLYSTQEMHLEFPCVRHNDHNMKGTHIRPRTGL